MQKSSEFEIAMKYLYSVEGGYSNNKADRGGATNFGITQSTYNAYRKNKGKVVQSVHNITKDEVEEIYYNNYWCLSGANKVKNKAIALILFDSAVNHGVVTAKQMYVHSGGNIEKFLNLRLEKYNAIAKRNPSQKIFLKGWNNRINKLRSFIAQNYKE